MNFIYACCLNSVEEVTSISWINALFACIIALIELGCYTVKYNTFQLKKRDTIFLDNVFSFLQTLFLDICYLEFSFIN